MEKICGACFEGCKELKEITIPVKVNYIEGGRYTETGASFLIYSGIEKVYFEDFNKWYRRETANASFAQGVANVFSDPVKACELLTTNIGTTTAPKYYYFYKKS